MARTVEGVFRKWRKWTLQKKGKVNFFMHPWLYYETIYVPLLFLFGSEMCNLFSHCSLVDRVDDVHVKLDETSPLMLL